MSNSVLTREAVANAETVLGDRSQLLAVEATDEAKETEKDKYPCITVARGSPFVQTSPGWNEIEAAAGEAVVPEVFQGTRFAQWFRFKNDRLEWGGKAWNDKTQSCDLPPLADAQWSPVKGVAGILTLHKSETESEVFFTIENATSASAWPLIRAQEHAGRMQTFKGKHGILVATPGKFIHRIGNGTVPGHPCYVCGCMIPGEYDKNTPLKDVRSAANSGAALDRIIECLGGWQENKQVKITVSG